MKTEKQQFSVFRDKNKDGRMDREEVADWIMPEDFDHVTAEARHLIQESDTNKVEYVIRYLPCVAKFVSGSAHLF